MISLTERNGELQAATGLMVAAAITLSTAGVRIAEMQTDHDDQQALLAAVSGHRSRSWVPSTERRGR